MVQSGFVQVGGMGEFGERAHLRAVSDILPGTSVRVAVLYVDGDCSSFQCGVAHASATGRGDLRIALVSGGVGLR